MMFDCNDDDDDDDDDDLMVEEWKKSLLFYIENVGLKVDVQAKAHS